MITVLCLGKMGLGKISHFLQINLFLKATVTLQSISFSKFSTFQPRSANRIWNFDSRLSISPQFCALRSSRFLLFVLFIFKLKIKNWVQSRKEG